MCARACVRACARACARARVRARVRACVAPETRQIMQSTAVVTFLVPAVRVLDTCQKKWMGILENHRASALHRAVNTFQSTQLVVPHPRGVPCNVLPAQRAPALHGAPWHSTTSHGVRRH
eukprot:gene11274-biopygen4840